MDNRQLFVTLELFAVFSIVLGQTSPAPVRILNQKNILNEDGSYTYAYENEDGSYKIETKSATGEIKGKYGYYDGEGKLREIEYGASERGFEPIGTDIKVPPPTIHVQNENNIEKDYDDGQYREDPSIYYKNDVSSSRPNTVPNHKQLPQSNLRFEANLNSVPPKNSLYRSAHRGVPYNVDPTVFRGHPASNFDPYSGSYNINYSG